MPEPNWRTEIHSQHFACDQCGRSFEPLTPHSFSFNSSLGWCPTCEGLPARAVRDAVLLPVGGSRELRSRRADPRPDDRGLSKVAAEKQVVIIASLFEKRAAGVYHNTAAVIDADGSLLGIYRKMHIPDDPLFYEKFYFTPGDLGFRAFDTAYGQHRRADLLGPVVSGGRAAHRDAGRGNSFLSDRHRLASGGESGVRRRAARAWETIQRAHAIANGVYVAAVNRVGHEKLAASAATASSSGASSFVGDPFGEVLAKASRTEEEILIVPCDRRRSRDVRRHWPFLRDRRIDAYGADHQALHRPD